MATLSYRMLMIDGLPTGLLGLTELFEVMFEAGQQPDDPEISDVLMLGIRKNNFVPKPAVPKYLEVLIHEYQQYYQKRKVGKEFREYDYGTWEGHPRENIPWFPTVSAELCDGCGNCLEVCPKKVFELDQDGKAVVVEPLLCIVGCCFCKSACDPHAILMPDRCMLDSYRHGQRNST